MGNQETAVPPCVIFENGDVLVVNKPPGWNTHSPSPYGGEGIYDWLKHREARWAKLAIVHRLDKDTSGLLVFGKTPLGNRSLTEQFTQRTICKRYSLVTERPVPQDNFRLISEIRRAGSRYRSQPLSPNGERAETHFRVVGREGSRTWLEAEPVTGRTHQIRVHAASEGLPILGDTLYGGGPANRLHLHAGYLEFIQPGSGETLRFSSPPNFATPAPEQLRAAFIDASATNVFRTVHGAADGQPGSYQDRLGAWLLLSGQASLGEEEWGALLANPGLGPSLRGAYFKQLSRHVRQTSPQTASPLRVLGEPAQAGFYGRENGVTYELSFTEGYSVGLFLDQRDNRRRLLAGHVAAGFPLYPTPSTRPPEVLNCFSYTCAFSVCAALGGARVTSLDLSRKYLDWGQRNFLLNGLQPHSQDFIYGDVFDWLHRLARQARLFDVLLLDPPTFSRSREHGDFRSETDYGRLVALALPLLRPEGILLASNNTTRLLPETFIAQVQTAIQSTGREILQQYYAPQPPDFPITREEPAHLKTLWLRIGAKREAASQ